VKERAKVRGARAAANAKENLKNYGARAVAAGRAKLAAYRDPPRLPAAKKRKKTTAKSRRR